MNFYNIIIDLVLGWQVSSNINMVTRVGSPTSYAKIVLSGISVNSILEPLNYVEKNEVKSYDEYLHWRLCL